MLEGVSGIDPIAHLIRSDTSSLADNTPSMNYDIILDKRSQQDICSLSPECYAVEMGFCLICKWELA